MSDNAARRPDLSKLRATLDELAERQRRRAHEAAQDDDAERGDGDHQDEVLRDFEATERLPPQQEPIPDEVEGNTALIERIDAMQAQIDQLHRRRGLWARWNDFDEGLSELGKKRGAAAGLYLRNFLERHPTAGWLSGVVVLLLPIPVVLKALSNPDESLTEFNLVVSIITLSACLICWCLYKACWSWAAAASEPQVKPITTRAGYYRNEVRIVAYTCAEWVLGLLFGSKGTRHAALIWFGRCVAAFFLMFVVADELGIVQHDRPLPRPGMALPYGVALAIMIACAIGAVYFSRHTKGPFDGGLLLRVPIQIAVGLAVLSGASFVSRKLAIDLDFFSLIAMWLWIAALAKLCFMPRFPPFWRMSC